MSVATGDALIDGAVLAALVVTGLAAVLQMLVDFQGGSK